MDAGTRTSAGASRALETAFLRHPAVDAAGVTGVPDDLRGEVIVAFVALKAGHEPSDELHRELLQTVHRELGPVAVIGHLSVATLPKTRSGKIMRRVLTIEDGGLGLAATWPDREPAGSRRARAHRGDLAGDRDHLCCGAGAHRPGLSQILGT